MKTCIVTLASAIFLTAASITASMTVDVNAIDANGISKKIGTLRLSDSKQGLRITPQLADLPPGDHGFHVHVNPDCGPGNGPNGQPAAGMAAGGHYDPANTSKHLGPHGEGHKGDMPVLTVDSKGKARKVVIAPHLTVADIKGRSPDTFTTRHHKLIVELAAGNRLPAVYAFRYFAVAGGLASYGPDVVDQFRRAGKYVDRILRGEKPGDLPVQQPTKFEFVINLKTAKALGITVPSTLLAAADEVIE